MTNFEGFKEQANKLRVFNEEWRGTNAKNDE